MLGPIPQHSYKDSIYLLRSRKSLYCVHREVPLEQPEEGRNRGRRTRGPSKPQPPPTMVTKSCIVGFRTLAHAERMKLALEEYQSQGRVVDGVLRGCEMSLESYTWGQSMAALNLLKQQLDDVQRVCLLNYLDLLLVHDVTRSSISDPPEWRLGVYTYITTEPPSRSLLNHQLERLLRHDRADQ